VFSVEDPPPEGKQKTHSRVLKHPAARVCALSERSNEGISTLANPTRVTLVKKLFLRGALPTATAIEEQTVIDINDSK